MSEYEADKIRERYARRIGKKQCDSDEDPYHRAAIGEWRDAVTAWSARAFPYGLQKVRVHEVGCGTGRNLEFFLSLGCAQENIVGSELRPQPIQTARAVLPEAVQIVEGDACNLDWPDSDFDVVLAANVFSSILDPEMRTALANRMWRLARPGGGILWYDFIFNNPSNPDVAGMPLREVRRLFPVEPERVQKITLAPPLGRCVVRLHPFLYQVFNAIRPLRTHLLCWIPKHPSL